MSGSVGGKRATVDAVYVFVVCLVCPFTGEECVGYVASPLSLMQSQVLECAGSCSERRETAKGTYICR